MARKRSLVQIQIGKNGLTSNVLEQIKRIFENEERVKIVILKSACRDKKEAEKMCEEIKLFLGKNFTYKLVGYVASFQKWRKERAK